MSNWLLGVFGGIVGGAMGYLVFFYLARHGLYALVLPGALVGLGCGYLSGLKSNGLGVACGIGAALLGLFVEWQFAPFVRDGGFAYFIRHVHQIKPITLVLIAMGGFFGYWFGKGREGGVGLRRAKD